jgi:Lysylphosphatidylglycerol synthase TM region
MDFFLLAIACLFAAHVVRTIRWQLLLPADYSHRRFNLLLGLALGYTVNTVVPWRLGELFRAWFVAKRQEVRFGYVAASVIVERLADALVVAALAAALALNSDGSSEFRTLATVLTTGGLLLVAFAAAVKRSRRVRKAVWTGASLFNNRIRFGVLDIVWTFSELTLGGSFLRGRFVLITAVMWTVYLASYLLFSHAIGATLDSTMQLLFGKPLHSSSGPILRAGDVPLLVFTAAPIIMILTYGLIHHWSTIVPPFMMRARKLNSPSGPLARSSQVKFKTEEHWEDFLVALFSGGDKAVSGFGLHGIGDVVVHKLYPGGSDAITALVELEDRLLIRKFADDVPGTRLRVQSDWLKRHAQDPLPFVQVIADHHHDGRYHYDMPLVIPANDFYDVIHTSSAADSRQLLQNVVDGIGDFHSRHAAAAATDEVIATYLERKAIANAKDVLKFASKLLPGPVYTLNGAAHSFEDWHRLSDRQWLTAQVRRPATATIHGDLTIENLIAAPNWPLGFYIIDPNPENIFDTPLLDYAKLMQSLHLGYEGLNRSTAVKLSGTAITLTFTRSHQYTELHRFYENLLVQSHGTDFVREVYFHEIVHYLRLTPYKIRQNPNKGLAFFACTSHLLQTYLERYP